MAELGDGVTVDDLYSVLAYRNVHFGPYHMSEIAAPSDGTIDHEYKYVSPTKREIEKSAEKSEKDLEEAKKELEDYSDTAAQDAVAGQTDMDILNKLTKNGERKGIFIQDDELYISASAIQTGILDAAKVVLSGEYGSILQGAGSTIIHGQKIPTSGMVLYGPLGDAGPLLILTNEGVRMSEYDGGPSLYIDTGYVAVQNAAFRAEEKILMYLKGDLHYYNLATLFSGETVPYFAVGSTQVNMLIQAGERIRLNAKEIVLEGALSLSNSVERLYNGNLSSGSTSWPDTHSLYIIMGAPNSSTTSLAVPSAAITSSKVSYLISDESNYRSFYLSKTGGRVTLAIRSGQGEITGVYGVL